MIANDIYEERKTRPRKVKTSFNGWYLGSYDWALKTLQLLGDDQSVPTAFWTVRFLDKESLLCFLLVWSNARRLPMKIQGMAGNTELGVWRVEDIVCFQFLRDREAILTPCVKIEFASREKRAAFRARADH
jgi:hypothetical protein